MLLRRYKWTFETIANLNPWQQLLAADVKVEDVANDVIEFETEAEYLAWKAEKHGNK